MFFCRFLQLAQERSEVEKLREKVKTLQEKLKQQKQKIVAGDEEGTGTEKPVVEEMITQDRVSVITVSLQDSHGFGPHSLFQALGQWGRSESSAGRATSGL